MWSVEYLPAAADERQVLSSHRLKEPVQDLQPAVNGEQILLLQQAEVWNLKKGTDVNFVGAFSSHPTVGGTVSPSTPDSASPIKLTNSGTSVTFTMDLAGTYPFYCEYHAPDMAGAVFVE